MLSYIAWRASATPAMAGCEPNRSTVVFNNISSSISIVNIIIIIIIIIMICTIAIIISISSMMIVSAQDRDGAQPEVGDVAEFLRSCLVCCLKRLLGFFICGLFVVYVL